MNLFYQPLIPQGITTLDAEESRHCVKVLRKNTGDAIALTDGHGNFYDAIITKPDPKACGFNITNTRPEPIRHYRIHIAIAPTKNADRLEWFVEKSTELGIDRITPIDTKHTERSFLKKERLEKVAISAMKQSIKASLPVIDDLTALTTLIASTTASAKFIAHVDLENPVHLKDAAKPGQHTIVLIGPEGDFSDDELRQALQHGFVKVSLGASRLRTETAGLAACHILNLVNG